MKAKKKKKRQKREKYFDDCKLIGDYKSRAILFYPLKVYAAKVRSYYDRRRLAGYQVPLAWLLEDNLRRSHVEKLGAESMGPSGSLLFPLHPFLSLEWRSHQLVACFWRQVYTVCPE